MTSLSDTQSALSQLADTFNDKLILGTPTRENAVGWGQFLDPPVDHKQVGLYGTCSGLIVLGLSNRTDNVDSNTISYVRSLWDNWKSSENKNERYFSQNLRLAYYHLALRILRHNDLKDIQTEVAEELLGRRHNHMWGDWWRSETDNDLNTNVFVTSMVFYSFVALRTDDEQVPGDLSYTHQELLIRIQATSDPRPFYELGLALSALFSSPWANITPRPKTVVNRLLELRDVDKEHLSIYLFDYKYMSNENDRVRDAQDYFIIPTITLLAISAINFGKSIRLRVRSEYYLKEIVADIRNNNGQYKPINGQISSTNNQAWAALTLASHEKYRSTNESNFSALTDWIVFQSTRDWSKSVVGSIVLFILIVGAITGNILATNQNSLLWQIFLTFVLLLVGPQVPVLCSRIMRILR